MQPFVRVVLALAVAPAALGAGVEELIVTGTRLATDEAQLPVASTVLSREEMDARGDAGVLDVLRAIPGIQVTQPGAGGVPQLFMRGAEPNYTLFMLDGIKVNDPTNSRGGSFDLSSVNPADLERIEIVRGPQSSIYGSDSLAGVVNMISAAGGERLAVSLEGEGGGDEFARASVALSGPTGTGGFSVRLTSRDDGEAVEGSTYEANTASARLRLAPSKRLAANLYARFADTEATSFPEQSGGPRLAVLRDLDQSSAHDVTGGADLDWRLSQRFSVQALVSRYERRNHFDSPGIAPPPSSPDAGVPANGSNDTLERDNASLRVTAGGDGPWTATAGMDLQRESGEARGYVYFGPQPMAANFALERDTVGLFAEGRARPTDRLLLQASIRHDEPDEVSGETTGRIGAIWSMPGHGTRLRANWGTGFKLPSFFALGSPLIGNPELRPEKSRSVDVGIVQQLGEEAQVSLTLFANAYEDFIDFDSEAFTSVNRDEVTSRGVEAAGSWATRPGLELRAHATWMDVDVEGAGELLQRPDWRGGVGVRWSPASRWLLDADWLYVGEVLDHAIATGPQTLDDYHRVDVNLAWQATARLRVALAVDNLLDAGYEEAIGFPAAGLRARLSARYLFGGAP